MRRGVKTSALDTSAPASRANPLSFLEDLRTRIEDALPEEAKKAALRAAYTSSAGLRFAFFLSQGVANSRGTDGRDIDVGAIAQAVARVVMSDDGNGNASAGSATPIVRKTMDGSDMSEEQAQEVSGFLEQHMGAILDVFKRECEFIENGTYKFPYDMDPSTAPAAQWNPLAVSALANANARDQRVVAERRNAKKGARIARNLRRRSEEISGLLLTKLSLPNRWVVERAERAIVRLPS